MVKQYVRIHEKRKLEELQTPVEKHDSTFFSPLVIFKGFPYNDTFIDLRGLKIRSIPSDDTTADTYTFLYKGCNYGMLKTSSAMLSADVQLWNIDDGAVVANNAQIILHSMPLRTMFKTKDLYINYALITTSTNNDHYTSYIRWLTTEVYDETNSYYRKESAASPRIPSYKHVICKAPLTP